MSLLHPHSGVPMLSGEWVGLEEALAWIQTRDAAFADSMQEEDALGRAALSAIREVVDGAPEAFDDEDQARRKLLQVLRHGIVTAHGRRDTPSAEPEPISTVEWSGLRFGSDARGNTVAMPARNRVGGSIWFDIVLQAVPLMSAIPEPRLFGGLADALAVRLAGQSSNGIEGEVLPSANGGAESIAEHDAQTDASSIGANEDRSGELKSGAAPAPNGAETPGNVEGSKRGRPALYNWSEFEAAALEKLQNEGSISRSLGFQQSDLEAYMAEWCGKHWAKTPVESVVRTHVVAVVRQFEAAKADNSEAGR